MKESSERDWGERGERRVREDRVEREKLYMYIYRIIYVYMSNNCIYVTGIHMNLYN